VARKYSRTSFSVKSRKIKNSPPVKRPNLEKRSREYITVAELKLLVTAAKQTGRHSARDSLLILMMFRHALRVGELVDLKWDQRKRTRNGILRVG